MWSGGLGSRVIARGLIFCGAIQRSFCGYFMAKWYSYEIFQSCVQLLGARVPSMRTLNCVVVERFWRVLWVFCGLMIFFRRDRGGCHRAWLVLGL